MQDEITPDLRDMFDEVQRLMLCVLLASADGRLTSLGELELLVGDRALTSLTVDGLDAAGLVYRLEGFVCASRAARRFHELNEARARLCDRETAVLQAREARDNGEPETRRSGERARQGRRSFARGPRNKRRR